MKKTTIKQTKGKIATEEYVDKRFDRLFVYLDSRFEPLEQAVKELLEFKDSVLTKLDKLISIFSRLDQEQVVNSHQYRRPDEKFENHESRIAVLEKKAVYKTS